MEQHGERIWTRRRLYAAHPLSGQPGQSRTHFPCRSHQRNMCHVDSIYFRCLKNSAVGRLHTGASMLHGTRQRVHSKLPTTCLPTLSSLNGSGKGSKRRRTHARTHTHTNTNTPSLNGDNALGLISFGNDSRTCKHMSHTSVAKIERIVSTGHGRYQSCDALAQVARCCT